MKLHMKVCSIIKVSYSYSYHNSNFSANVALKFAMPEIHIKLIRFKFRICESNKLATLIAYVNKAH